MAKDIQFHYFYGRGIGEPIRLLLTVGGSEFVDHRYSLDEFAGMDALNAALEIDGVFLGQTDSLMRLAARLAKLYPGDLIAAARSDMIVIHQADIHSAIAKMSFDGVPGAPGTKMMPEPERKERIDAWFESTLPGKLAQLDRLAEDGVMVGNQLSWADICMFNRLTQLLDMNGDLLKGKFPKLRAVYENVAALPSVQKWIDAHAQDYPRGNAINVE